ncbi:MAG: AbrB family transcriptional regulator, partial [Firmicutes bacterium]|nr:AbrB family transcriptional regulator [Bacillota bacterium]
NVQVNYLDIAIAACAAIILNILFRKLGISLPVIVVSILAGSLITIFYREYKLPRYTAKLLQTCVGAYTGSMITRQVIASMGQLWVGIVLVFIFLMLCLFVNALILEKMFGISRLTSIYICAPGGLSEITLLAEETGGDIPTIAALQTFRLLTIVVLISALAPMMLRIAEIL